MRTCLPSNTETDGITRHSAISLSNTFSSSDSQKNRNFLHFCYFDSKPNCIFAVSRAYVDLANETFMACSMGAIMVQSATPLVENEGSERSCMPLKTCAHMQRSILKPSFSGRISRLGVTSAPIFEKSTFTRHGWRLAFALDTGGIPDNSGQESIDGDNTGLGGTRLGRIVRAGGKQLLEKLNAARRNSPMKIFLVLLGFYTANALATILGQTGDWDVLVAGVVVAAIEGIGMLMYRKPMAMPRGRLQSLVVMVNYWKAGVCLGLFVDAFKLGS